MKRKYFVIYVLVILLDGCMGGGTHGSIKSYQYHVSKYTLEKAVHNIIAKSNTIQQDTAKDYYNDDTTYITMHITYGDIANTYTFRYGGGKEYWDTSMLSSVFIAYAYNKKREGGSEGNGGVKWYNYKLKKELTEPFEREFISKLDSTLSMKHTEE